RLRGRAVQCRGASARRRRLPVAQAQASARRPSRKTRPGPTSDFAKAMPRSDAARPKRGDDVMLRLFPLRVVVKDGERALISRDGRLERVLGPGRHVLFDPARALTVELFQTVRTEFPAERHAVLKAARPELAAELFEAVETRANELAIVSLD